MKKRVLALLLAFVVLFQIIQPSFAAMLEETFAEETVSEEVVSDETDTEETAKEETQESESENDESSIEETLEEKIESENTAAEEETDEAVVENVESDESTEAEESEVAGEKTLTILHVNDTHGRYNYEEGSVIGYAKAKTIIDEFKANGPAIALDSGDATHGTNFATLSQGESIVKLLDLTGFSAIVPGNHDFNYGKDRLLELSQMGSNLEFLSANIKVKEDGSNFLQANDVFDVDGIKVGVFGLSTPETVYKSHPNNTAGLDFDQVVSSAQASVEDLKAKGADVIVLLSHLGTDLASEVNTFTLLDELSNKDDIDVIIDGHSHSLYPNGHDYNGSFIASTGQHFNNIGVTTITINEDGTTTPASRMINVSDDEVVNAEENQEVLDLINQYESANEEVLSQVIGNTTTELDGLRENVRTKETNLADLITDAMRTATGADAALTNGGGIRASIDAGEIRMGEALTVLPFGNLVTVIEATGQDIVDAIVHGASQYPNPNGGFPQVSGIEYTIDASTDEVKIVNVKIGGQPVDLTKTYKLATNDFMAVGGDGYTMFEGAYQDSLHGSMLDIFADYIGQLSANGPFTAETDGRIKVNTVAKPETMEAPVNNTPNRVIATFKGDTQTQKAFNWYTTDKIEDSEVLVSTDKSMSNPMTFTPEIEEVSSMYYERAKDGRFLYKALKDGEVIGYFTDENEVYIGVLEQGKTTKLNYKSKKEINVHEDDWIVIENAHEAIINKSTFALANKMLLRDLKTSKETPSLFAGMLYCADCGSALVRRKVKTKKSITIYYICSNYNRSGQCSRHSIKEDDIKELLKESLNLHLARYRSVLEKISKLDLKDIMINANFSVLEKEKEKYERLRQSLYMDLEDELITTEEFDRYSKNYLLKIKQIEEQIKAKRELVEELEKRLKDKESSISNFVPTDELNEVNRAMLITFIDKVEVLEDGSLNFIYNNIETVTLLEKIADRENVRSIKKPVKPISIHQAYARVESTPRLKAVEGGR